MKNKEETTENTVHEKQDETGDKKIPTESMHEHEHEKGNNEEKREEDNGHKAHVHKENKHGEKSKHDVLKEHLAEHLKNSTKDNTIVE